MKFKELFHLTNGKFYPDWDKILSIKEFRDLTLCKQSTVWHKEGHVFNHTVAVTNEMVNYLYKEVPNVSSEYFVMMVSAALCHDLGKPSTTWWDEELQEYKTKCHGQAGEKITRKLFYDEAVELREKVCFMVRHHMILHHILEKKEKIERSLKRMSWGQVTVNDMLILNMCDSFGSKNDVETRESILEHCDKIRQIALDLGCYVKPFRFNNKVERRSYFTDIPYDDEFATYDGFTIYMMIGLPGAGKDTYIKDTFGTAFPVLCRDEIRTEIGLEGVKPQGNKKQEDYVTRIFNKRFLEYCKERKSFVINNTNVVKKHRTEFLKMAMEYNPRVLYIYVEADDINKNYDRRREFMDTAVIDRMFDRFDFPEPWEYDGLIIERN